MSNNLIDGLVLIDDLRREFDQVVINTPELRDKLVKLMILRRDTHDLVNYVLDCEVEYRKVAEENKLQCLTYLWEFALEHDEQLPDNLIRIVRLVRMIREKIDLNERRYYVEKLAKKPNHGKGSGRRKHNKNISTSEADLYFEMIKTEFLKIIYEMMSPVEGGKMDLKDRDVLYRVKFGPFVELAKFSNVSAEAWMDSEEARHLCADCLVKILGFSKIKAAAFYAHVTASFRNRENSMWQDYLNRVAANENPADSQ